MTHRHLRLTALGLLLGGLLLSMAACGSASPKTPAQALLEGRASLGVAVAAFNVYAGQRPFCNDPGAKAPPLCADRQAVIEGGKVAHQVASAFDRAEVIINATGTAELKWSVLGGALKQLVGFQALVAKTKGGN